MSSPKEGMYAAIAIGGQGTILLLTGVELSWTQPKKLFYANGSLVPAAMLHGRTEWMGNYKAALGTMMTNLGTFNLGTWTGTGTIYPRGGTNPYIAGTMSFTGGNLSNMATETIDAVEESQGFILYNVTIQA